VADVTGPFRGRTDGVDRGQLFVVAALALATLLVALAVLMNAAIFTENLSTRSGGSDVRGALESRTGAASNAAGLIRHANYHDNGSYADLDGGLRASVRDYSAAAGVHGSVHGHGVNATLDSSRNGTRIVQDDSGDFTSASDGDNWTLVSNARTRDLLLNVSASALEPSPGTTVEDYRRSHAFQVVYVDGGTEYQVFVYDDSGDVGVQTVEDDGSPTLYAADCTATPSGGRLAIDVERGLVGGEACPSLSFVGDLGTGHDLAFRNATPPGGASVEGTYELVTDEDVSTLGSTSRFNSTAADGDPYVTPAVYRAHLMFGYDSGSVDYRTRVTANPAHVPRRYGVAGAGAVAGGGGGGGGGGGVAGGWAPNGSVTIDSTTDEGGNEYDVTVSYTVDDGDDDMTSIDLVLKDPDGNGQGSKTLSAGSSPDTSSATFQNVKITGNDKNEAWTVELTVYDDDGNTGTGSDTEDLP